MPLMPKPAARARGTLATTPIRMVMTAATNAVAGCHGRGIDARRAQDQWVHGHDIDHDHERGDAGPDLGPERRAPFVELEE